MLFEETLSKHPSLLEPATKFLRALFKQTNLTEGIDFLPEKLIELYQDDIFQVYYHLNTVLPELGRLDKASLNTVILQSSMIQNLLHRSSQNEPDNALRLQSLALFADLWYDEH